MQRVETAAAVTGFEADPTKPRVAARVRNYRNITLGSDPLLHPRAPQYAACFESLWVACDYAE